MIAFDSRHSLGPGLLALLLGTGCAGPTNRLGSAPLSASQALQVTDSVDLSFSLTMADGPLAGNTIAMKNRVDSVITVAVKERDDKGPRVLSLDVGDANIAVTFSLMGVEKNDPAPFANTSYLATRGESGFEIGRADGGPIAPEERDFLASRAAALASGGQIRPCLPDGPLTVGLRIDDLAPCRSAVIRDDKFLLKEGSLVLTALTSHEGRSAAHFDLAMRLQAGSGGGGTVKTPSLVLDVKGKLVVDLDPGRNLLVQLEGPVSSGGDGGGTEVSGDFAMSERTAFVPGS